MAIISTEGDGGDVVFCLNIIKHLPDGPHSLVLETSSVLASLKSRDIAEKFLVFIKDFVEAQDYIKECRIAEPTDNVYWRSGGFRGASMHVPHRQLMMSKVAHFRMALGHRPKVDVNTPWIKADPSPLSQGRVLINRTSRYNNQFFQWRQIVEHYGDLILFVGHDTEYSSFCSAFGKVERVAARNLMDIASLVSGCELFIGNQSCANALAEGLKKPIIQETSLKLPDCVFVRPHAQHVWDGSCTLPAIGNAPEKFLTPHRTAVRPCSTAKAPPGMWQYPGAGSSPQFSKVVAMSLDLPEMKDLTRKEIETKILFHNLDRCPLWQTSQYFNRVRAALEFQPMSASQASGSQDHAPYSSMQESRAQYRTRVGVKS